MIALLCLSLIAGTQCASAPSSCSQICPANYAPVCGSDGRTYSNDCQLQSSSCTQQQNGRPPVVRQFYGACGSGSGSMPGGGPILGGGYPLNTGYSCDQMCDEERSPICASNGVVYDNMCRFTLANCDAHKNGTNLKVISHSSTCNAPTAPNCEKYAMNVSDIALEGPFGDNIKTICKTSDHQVCTDKGSFSSECHLCQQIEHMIEMYKNIPGVKVPEYKIYHDGPCHGSSYPTYPNYPGGYPGSYPGGLPIDPSYPDPLMG